MILIDGFVFDASLAEKHTLNSEATEFPVEQGADLTDHIRQLPLEVEIEGIVSDTPIGEVATLRDAGSVTLGDGPIADAVLPSAEALAHLEHIRDRRLPVTIQTGLGARPTKSAGKIYERMAMTKLDIPLDRATGNALRFNVTFRQITLVTNLRTTVRTATPGGSGRANLGTKSASIVNRLDDRNNPAYENSEQMWFDSAINCWRKSWRTPENANEHIVFAKGPLRDGFKGSDAELRVHIAQFPDGPRNDRFMPKGFGRPGQLSHGNVGKNRVVPKNAEEAAELNRRSAQIAGADNLGRGVLASVYGAP